MGAHLDPHDARRRDLEWLRMHGTTAVARGTSRERAGAVSTARSLTLGLLPLIASGCLIVSESGDDDDASHGSILPLGQVHGCAVAVPDVVIDHKNICFGGDLVIARWEVETMKACGQAGTPCEATCSPWPLHPCVLACAGTGLTSGCNATHGCYCPTDD